MPRNDQKVIFIDRDGVINRDPIGDYIKRWKDFAFLPKAISAMRKLTNANYQIVIISNQAGVGDGAFTKKALDTITKNMLSKLEKHDVHVKAVYYCLHGKKAGCECRKPKVGLFKKASKTIRFNKRRTYFVGDKVTDVKAGKNFGLKTAFVLTGHGRYDLKEITTHTKPNIISKNLFEVVCKILK